MGSSFSIFYHQRPKKRFTHISQVPLRSLAARMKNSITLSQIAKPLRGNSVLLQREVLVLGRVKNF